MTIARLVLLLAAVATAAVLTLFAAAAQGAPTVTEVAVTSDGGDDDTYALGETIRVTVTFSEAVDVTGAPELTIGMDPAHWGEKRAVYASGSGTAALMFAHEVVGPNYSTRGVAVLENTLALAGGTIRSASSQADAALAHVGLPHNAAHKVDWRLSPDSGTPPDTTPPDTPPRDTTPPRLVRGEIDGGTMTLWFSEALDPASTGGRFDMSVQRSERATDRIGFRATGDMAVDGATVTVGMGKRKPRAKPGLQGGNRVRYSRLADGSDGPLRDLAGNPVLTPDRLSFASGKVWWYVRIDLENVTGGAPGVTGVAVASDAGGDDTYALGETIRVEVTFAEAVAVDTAGGTPRLKIKMDPRWGEFWADYASGGGTNALTFAYRVAEPNTAPSGIAVLADTLALNGGTIRSAATQAAAQLSHAGLGHDAAHKVDWRLSRDTTPPRLLQGELDGGTMTLWFSEALDPNRTGGRFQVGVQVSETSSHGFDASGPVAIDGEVVTVGLGKGNPRAQAGLTDRNSLLYLRRADGADGALRDIAGNPVLTPHTPAGPAGAGLRYVLIDLENVTGAGQSAAGVAVTPTVTGVAVTSDAGDDGTYALGETIRVAVTFSEAVDVDTGGGTPWLTISMGPYRGEFRAAYESGSGTGTLTFAYRVAKPNTSLRGIAVPAGTLALDGGAIRSAATQAAADLAHAGLAHDPAHKVDGVPPKPSAMTVSRTTLTLTFYHPLGPAASLANDAFKVTKVRKTPQGDVVETVSLGGSPAISGNKLTLTLANALQGPDAGVTLSYTRPTSGTGNRLRDEAGNEMPSFHLYGVEATPFATGLAISSDPGSDTYSLGETLEVRLAFSEAVIVTGTPRLKLDFGSGTGDERWAVYASGSGTTMLEFAYAVAERDLSTRGVAVLADTLELAGGAVLAASTRFDADLMHAGLDHDTAHKVDGIAPTLTAAAVNGAVLTLAFDESLDEGLAPAGGAFTVTAAPAEGAARNIAGTGAAGVAGTALTVTLAGPVSHGETLTVAYAPPEDGRLRDLAGNEAGGFSERPAENGTAAAPAAAIEAVAVVSNPGADATYAAGDAVRVRLTLDEAVDVDAGGGTPRLKIGLDPAGGGERWAAYEGGTGTSELTFAFVVTSGDASAGGVAVLADTLELNGGTIASTANQMDAALGHAGLAHDPAHKVDAKAPAPASASVNGTTLTVTFDEALGAAANLANAAFEVKRTPESGTAETVGMSGRVAPAINGRAVTLTLATAIVATDTGVKVSYTPPTSGTGNRLRDVAGNEVATFADRPVAGGRDTTPPTLVRGEIDGGTITLYFSEAMNPNSAGGTFRVLVQTSLRSFQFVDAAGDVAISGNRVTVGLGEGKPRTKAGLPRNEFEYIPPEGWARLPTDSSGKRLRDLAGNPVRTTAHVCNANECHWSMGWWGLDNVTGDPSVTGVAISSDAGDDRTYALGEIIRVTVAFGRAVAVTGAPRVKIDLGSGAGNEKWADYERSSGATTLVFAYAVTRGDTSNAGVAVLANTLELNGGTIRGVARSRDSNLAHGGLAHNLSHKVDGASADTTPPALSGKVVAGTKLTLAFNEPLGVAASLTNVPFTVKKMPQGGGEQIVSLTTGTPAIEGSMVTLTLASAVLETDTGVKVSYARPTSGTGNRLRDAAGNEAASFADEPVAKARDTTPPALVRGGIDGRTMTLYFSEPLDPDSVGGKFKVNLQTAKNSWSEATARGEVAISGNVVTVGLVGRAAVAGLRATARYVLPFDPAVNQLRDLAGNRVKTYRGFWHTQFIQLNNVTGVVLSVADARANEGVDAAVVFEVSLNRAFTHPAAHHKVRVDYATADGSAKAGEDYTATSGTLIFGVGERVKTVRVAILDDAIDEGEETFRLRLSNARWARIGDGEAIGTIGNADPLQKMWLSRFGRTVASHVTDAVSDRLANPLTGAQVTVGGQRVDLAAMAEDKARVGEALTAVARALDAREEHEPGGEPGSGSPGSLPGTGGWPATGLGRIQTAAPGGTPAREVTGRELLLGSAFHLAREGDGAGPGLAAWGRVTVGGFDGEAPAADDGRVRIDGNVTTGILGADAEWNRLLAGVAISVSEGEGTFDQPGVDKGAIESTMTMVSPYARFMVNDRVSVWGLAGWGTGDMTIVQAANENQPERVTRTDLEMRLIAGGGRGALIEADEAGGIDLALKADAFYVETESEAVSNEGSTTGVASRVRLALEGSRVFLVGGGVLTPGLELGLRHDGGDAETGTGVELGGRVSYTDPDTGLSVEANVRALVAHEDSNYREWGASGALRLAPGERGRGLSFSLAPTYGTPSGGADRLWSARDARGLNPGGTFEPESRLEGELGYGLALFGDRFTGTPNLGFGLSGAGARDYRIGWRLTSVVRGDPGFEVNLDATRREPANDNGAGTPVEHGVMLRAGIRW